MTTKLKVSVKWSGRRFDDIMLDLNEPAATFKSQLFSLTGVEPERQKILVKGGTLKDDTDLKSLQLKDGHVFMMMGTPSESQLKEPAERPKFIEDMTEQEANMVQSIPPGLTNLGNTCYMNATLQCLHVIPELNQALDAFQDQFSQDPSKNVVIALRALFKLLSKSGEAIPPLVFLQALRSAFPQFAQQSPQTGQFAQQDAEECFTGLVSTLDRLVKSTDPQQSSASFVNQYMSGVFEAVWRSDEAPTEEPTKTLDTFNRLSCHISSDVNYLSQGLKEALTEKIEKMSPSLGRSIVYTKKSHITRLPKYLTISFVRFFWKQDTRAVKFPVDLDMNEFCAPELQEKMRPARELLHTQQQAKQEVKKKRKTDAGGDVKITLPDDVPRKTSLSQLIKETGASEHAQYELIGVLTHVGRTADAGHYMAWTRKDEDTWYKFDDDKVTPVKTDDILKLYGGGDWHMAYLLIYKSKELE